MNTKTIHLDVVIFGGGIAGLWALNRLKKLGYQAILLETNALGSGQTICSQGIIHGGLKYALTGLLSDSSTAIESMPKRWKTALAGQGEIDLRAARLLSDHQLIWSTGNLRSEISSFFASKLLKSRIQKLHKKDFPSVLQDSQFKGHIYRLDEMVLDPHSLLKALATPVEQHLFKIDKEGYHFHFDKNHPENILNLELIQNQKRFVIKAQRYLFTAGEGNERLTQQSSSLVAMQRRPLQMVVIKSKNAYPLFAHCIGSGTTPRITITTHPTLDGESIWYLGGQLAESGVNRTPEEQIAFAKKEVCSLFPWLDFTQAKWSSFFINRAEPKQAGGKRPETAFVKSVGNALIAWPTKLALSPLLVDKIVSQIEEKQIKPSIAPENNALISEQQRPQIALPIWEQPNFI